MKKLFNFRLLILIGVLITSINTTWAYTSRTVYYAIPAGTIACQTVKLNTLVGDSHWENVTMVKEGMWNNNSTDYVVYQAFFEERYGGVDIMQFLVYDGSTHKDDLKQQPISSWTTTATYSGKMYVYNTGWRDHAVDGAVSYRVYFVNKDSWSKRYTYAYYANCHNNWSWPGQSMTSASKQYSGKDIYYMDLTSPFPNVIFNNDDGGSETSSSSCYSNRGKMYYDGRWYTLQYTVSLNMQSGSGGSSSVTAVCGSAMPSATMPTRDGYTFAGYYTGTSGSGTKYYNADGSSAANWPSDGTGPTTLYAHWTQDPGVATLTAAGSATELWIGVNPSSALTFTATSSNVSSGTAVTWSLTDNTGDCTVSTTTSSYSGATFSYTPGSTGAKTVTVTMTIGGNNYTKTYSLTVYERWNIYVKNNCSWANMALYEFIDGSTDNGSYPGRTAPITGYGVKDWKKVTLDSKWTYFIINNNISGSGEHKTYDCTTGTSSGTYAEGTYWYFVYSKDDGGKKVYTLTKMTLSAPTVTINIDKTNVNQITVTGTITAYGGYGTTASEMEAVGFKIGETNYTASYTSGSTFSKTITSLTANTSYTVKAYATNIKTTGESSGSSTTTLANSSYTIKVQVPHGDAPHVYAWTDADDFGGSLMTNIDGNADLSTGDAPAMTKIITGDSYDWYSYSLHNKYEKLLFYATKNSNNSQNLNATRAAQCYWYKKSESTKAGTMDCPYETPQVYIESTAGGGSFTYKEMSTSPSISKTFELTPGTYKFKIVYNAEYYGKGSDQQYGISRTGTTSSNSIASTAVDGGYLTITADFTGNYTFTFNPSSSNTVSVTYPTAYTVTYSAIRIGNGTAWDTDPSATYTTSGASITSTHYVPVETDVTFTAPAAKSGYTWKGWYNGPTLSDTKLSTNDDLTYALEDIDANTTVYAIYQEDMHTVTVTAGAHGSITTPESPETTVQAGIATTADIVTTNADYGYYFSGWTVEEGTAYFGDASAKSTTVRATTDAVIKANYVSHWTIAGGDGTSADGDDDEMGDWNVYKNGIEDFAQDASNDWIGHVDIDLPANTTFYFKVRDLNNSNWYGNTGTMTYGNSSAWDMDLDKGNCTIITAGAGTYTFTWNETKEKLTVTYPTSYTVTYNVSTFYNEDALHDYDNTTGGSISYKKDNDSIELVSGKYVVAGGTMTFKATPASGYRFAGWYQNQACSTEYTNGSDGAVIDDGVLTLTILDDENNKTVYAKFTENMTTVTFAHNEHGHVEIGGATVTSAKVGVHTMPLVTASADANYYFAGWVVSPEVDPDYSVSGTGEENTTITVTGAGAGATSGQTLTARFVELEKIYFRNWNEGTSAPLWSDVYVYFSISTEKSGDDDCAKSNVSTDYYTKMTQIGTTNVYWAYVPRGTTKHSDRRIAFSNHDFGTNYKFLNYEASMRNDYDKTLNMFVPYRTVKSTKNGTKYYDDGFWKTYGNIGEKSGYYIDRWDFTESKYKNPASKGTGDDWQFVITGDNTIEYELRIDNPDNTYNSYAIASLVGTKYNTSNSSQTGTAITMANCESGVQLHDYQDNPRFSINPTSQGIYTITIDQSSDKMKIYVNYPVMLNDYRIKHTYTIDAKKDSAYSDVIKNSAAGSGVTASMYINTINSPTLTLEKCTDVSTNPVKWTKQGGDLWSTLGGNFDKGKGVYKFDVTINTSTNTITDIDKCGIYDGEFYIKTDIASGGWTAWKANVMEKNTLTFNKADSKTFDRSYCHWVGSTSTNIKCVIANDYNIAVSDTLEGDAIIGVGNQTLPSAAHVRFSYNSTTNELKRTYLAVSGVDHLIMEGNTLSSGTVFMIHDNTADQGAAFTNNKATLENQSNFTFGLDIKARETARVRLSAKYNNVVQYLVGNAGTLEGESNANTVEIMGGSSSVPGYNNIRISYDFKTNQLLSAWLPPTSGDSPDKAINADVMIIREEQGDARQITFAKNTDALSAVDTVYGVMKFNKYSLNNRNKTNTADSVRSAYARDLYWISFPFDVKLSDAFGMGTYGTHWIIERYDGKGRAKNGFWADSEPNWKFVTPYMRDTGFVMKANEGYILALDLVELGYSSLVWDNNMTEAYLYFPSQSRVGNIKEKTVELEIDTVGYTCTINRGTPDGNRTIKDSHWHCIGAPSFANIDHATGTSWVDENEDGNKDYPNVENWKTNTLLFVYDWNSEYNTLTPVSAASHNFKAMHAYMVQYSQPTISWTSASTPVASVAARLADTPDREYQLALLREDEEQDHTYVRLSDNENVTAGFEFNYDLSKEMNRNRGNIWTVTTDVIPVAGNCMPHPLSTTIVPVGVKIATSGEYTFTMQEGTNGENVWLLDNQTNSRTNLGLMDYTVNLTAGTIDGRFSLEFGPIQDAPTGIDEMSTVNSQLSTDSVRKVFVGGRLYIIRDGKAYDATGAQVR